MDTALTFHPTKMQSNTRLLGAFITALGAAESLAKTMSQKSCVLMQHNLKQDVFVMLVECGKWTFASYKKKPRDVCNDVATQIYKHIERVNAEQQAKERPSGKKSSRGPGRQSSARLRRS